MRLQRHGNTIGPRDNKEKKGKKHLAGKVHRYVITFDNFNNRKEETVVCIASLVTNNEYLTTEKSRGIESH